MVYHVDWFADDSFWLATQVNPTWLKYMSIFFFSYLKCCWLQFFNILLRILHLCLQGDWPVIFFFIVFFWFWYQGHWWWLPMSLKASSLLYHFEEFEKNKFSRIHQWSPLVLYFCLGELLYYRWNFISDWSVKIFYFIQI